MTGKRKKPSGGENPLATYGRIECGDVLEKLRAEPSKSVDLVFGSPPYEKARMYAGTSTRLESEQWVAWMVEVFREAARVSRGLVAMVCEGRTRQYDYSAAPFLLLADLKRAKSPGVARMNAGGKVRAGVRDEPTFRIRKPPAYVRYGIPGSGGRDWWRNDYEPIICATSRDVVRLPWADPLAIGEPPKYERGGVSSNRMSSDSRAKGKKYARPAIANPGNVRRHNVGGGLMGSDYAHENEAPFPQTLAREFVLCFCPPGGVVLDPFSGSGTTAAAAVEAGRRFVAFDLRPSQVELSSRRVGEAVGRILERVAE